jgi:hypothetical protein
MDEGTWEGLCSILEASRKMGEAMSGGLSQIHLPAQNPSDIICGVCGRKFSTPSRLHKHRKVSHEGEGRVICEVCNKSFASAVSLHAHQLLHRDPTPAPVSYKCNLCEAEFVLPRELGLHRRNVHPGTGTFLCLWPGCTKKYGSARSRGAHSSNCTKNPEFQWKRCLYKGCRSRCARQTDLNKHMKEKHGWKK